MKSNRRKFILSSMASVASGLALASCSGGTPDKPSKSASVNKNIYKWKMSTAFPKNFPGSDLNAQKLKNYIENASDGQLVIEHFGAGEIIPAYEIFDAVRNGTMIVVYPPLTIGYQSIKQYHFFALFQVV